MYGAMFGDYVGSVYEHHNIKTKEFKLFSSHAGITDDTYMTIAVASACLGYAESKDIVQFTNDVGREMWRIGRCYRHPKGGYGSKFKQWLKSENPVPYNSWGNGSAMRVSPCAWIAENLEEAEALAVASAMPTHNHPEGMAGAAVTAGCVYLARSGKSKEEILAYIRESYDPMGKTLDEIRPSYRFHSSCRGTIPVAMQAFLESTDYEDAIRNAVSVGGDSDTIAAITGAVAEAFYGFPARFVDLFDVHLECRCDPQELEIIRQFCHRFCSGSKK